MGFAVRERGKPMESRPCGRPERRHRVRSIPDILAITLDGLREAKHLVLQVGLLLSTLGEGAWKWWGSDL